ncbi:MAG: hypothetical protein KDD44_04265 [Bdellovibrionales bacterium]|nr:hypothetical protein [Bdellovibrionales bacterium]
MTDKKNPTQSEQRLSDLVEKINEAPQSSDYQGLLSRVRRAEFEAEEKAHEQFSEEMLAKRRINRL